MISILFIRLRKSTTETTNWKNLTIEEFAVYIQIMLMIRINKKSDFNFTWKYLVCGNQI